MKTKNKIMLVAVALIATAIAILWATKAASTETVPTAPKTTKANPCVKVMEARNGNPAEYDCTEDIATVKKWAACERAKVEAELEIAKGKRRKVSVTGYSSRPEETDGTPCISADGSDICALYAKGQRICATNDYPMHTVLEIEGIGTCVVRDRMNRRYTDTNRVDYYYGYDTKTALNHGVKMAIATIKE